MPRSYWEPKDARGSRPANRVREELEQELDAAVEELVTDEEYGQGPAAERVAALRRRLAELS